MGLRVTMGLRVGLSPALLSLASFVLSAALGGCSSDTASSDRSAADQRVSDAGLPSDGQNPESVQHADGPLLLPGCPSICGADQVCHQGVCTTVGPDKACSTSTYEMGLPASGVIYVNGAWNGPSFKGTASEPFKTISDALAAVSAKDKIIAVAKGTYAEQLVIAKDVELRCKCAAEVTIEWRSWDESTERYEGPIRIESPSNSGISVVIDGCKITPPGYASASPSGWPTCTDSDPEGIYALGPIAPVDLWVRNSEIAGWCSGIYMSSDYNGWQAGALCVSRSALRRNIKGIDVSKLDTLKDPAAVGCKEAAEGVAVELSSLEENKDRGFSTGLWARGVSLQGNLVTRSGRLGPQTGGEGLGIYLGNIESARVVGNRVEGCENRGIGMINWDVSLPTTAEITNNALSDNHGAGIALHHLEASKQVTVSGNLVTATGALSGHPDGDGIQVSVVGGVAFNVAVSGNTVQSSARNGILLDGAGGTVTGNTISASGSYGVVTQQSTASIGANTYSGNAAGPSASFPTAVNPVASLPIPLP